PGELQRLAKRERKPEAVHQTKTERDHPPSLDSRADDVFERHVDDRGRNQQFDEWGEPQRCRCESLCRCDERDGMRNRERSDDCNQWPEPAHRDYEAKHEQEMVDAPQDVPEAELHECQRRLMPSRIEAYEA